MPTNEPSVRVLMGLMRPDGDVLTCLVSLASSTRLTDRGWIFIAADPDDLQDYLAWLYKRETDTT